MSLFLRNLASSLVWAALAVAALIPILLWGSDKAPDFYAPFVAALVAAIAVILGAYYQAELARRRDDESAKHKTIAEATDLYLWLGYAESEMELIEAVLLNLREYVASRDGAKLDLSVTQYRELVSSQFMDEIRDRAKVAARLSPGLGAVVAPILYDTFQATARVYRLPQSATVANYGPAQIERHASITKRRIEKLKEARSEVAKFLAENGVHFGAPD
jgi:hypothetical protein